MQHGLNVGIKVFADSSEVKEACGKQYSQVESAFHNIIEFFNQELQHDTYVFCLSEHDEKDHDGVLSMWRGYGDQGKGAAIIFNSGFIDKSGRSPLLIPKVRYMSAKCRYKHTVDILNLWCSEYKEASSCDEAVAWLFDCLLFNAITTKHDGFKEEREWRLVYLRHRDRDNLLSRYFHYTVGTMGAELKLKLPIAPLPGDTEACWSFSSILDG